MHLVDSCNRNQDKLWLNKPLPTSTDFTSCFAGTNYSGKELIITFSLRSDYSDIESTSEEQHDYEEVTYEVISFSKLTRVRCIIYQCVQGRKTE